LKEEELGYKIVYNTLSIVLQIYADEKPFFIIGIGKCTGWYY